MTLAERGTIPSGLARSGRWTCPIPRLPAIFREAGLDALPALHQAMSPAPYGEIQSRFETGRRCYTAWSEDRLVAYGWVSYDEEWIGESRLDRRRP
jgi:hypothetical protein